MEERESFICDIDDEYCLCADTRNWILVKKGISKKGKSEGNATFVSLGFFSNLSSLLKAVLSFKSKKCNVASLRELIDEIKSIEDRVYPVLEKVSK